MNVAFTGHRPDKLGGYNDRTNKRSWFMTEIDKIIRGLGPDIEIISGMALGVDQWAAEYAASKKIPFYAYVPFKGQECKWPSVSKAHYGLLLNMAKEVKYICDSGYAPWKMQKRNEAMVDDCDLLIAVWNGAPGGTENCIKYATGKKKIIRLDPLCITNNI